MNSVLLMLAFAGVARPSAADETGAQAPFPMAPVYDAHLVNGGVPLPANGALIFQARSSESLWVQVSDALGNDVSGTLAEWHFYTVWTPSSPLDVGASYQVTFGWPGEYTLTHDVFVTEPFLSGRPHIEAHHTTSLVRVEADQRCCRSILGPVFSRCFPTTRTDRVVLETTFTSPLDASALHQHVFGVDPIHTGMTPLVRLREGSYSFEYRTQSSEYCLRVRASEFAGDIDYDYDDLATLCAPHGDLGDLESEPIDVVAEGYLHHEQCQVPPEDFERDWCEFNAACDRERTAIGCEAFGHVCLGEERPTPIPTIDLNAGVGTGDDAHEGAAGLGGDGGTPSAGMGSEDGAGADANASRSTSGGCSIAVGSRGSPSWLWATLGLWMMFRRARLRQPRRHGPHEGD